MTDIFSRSKQRKEFMERQEQRAREFIENWDVLNNWEEGFKELYTIEHDRFGRGCLLQDEIAYPECSQSAFQIYTKVEKHGMHDKCPPLLEKLASKSASTEPEKLKYLDQNIDFLLETNPRPDSIPLYIDMLPAIMEASNRITGKNEILPEKSFLQKIVSAVNKFKEYNQEDYPIRTVLRCCVEKSNPQSILTRLTILEQGVEQTRDCKNFIDLYDGVDRFEDFFPELSNNPKFTQNCIDKILPRTMKHNDIFGFHSNMWGCVTEEKGIAAGVGIATFFYKCYATPINPRGINDLLQMTQENLSGNLAKHEQIRADAHYINFSRDPIHDSVPGINDLIGSMIAYYNAPTEENRAILQERLQRTPNLGDRVFDLQNYESVGGNNEKTIDVLRRIYSNMSQNNMELPITENARLNELATQANQSETPTITQISPLVKEFNRILLEAIDTQQVGLSPETVELLAWTDKKLALALNAMDFEKQSGFYKTEECREALLFSDLTHSAKENYNLKEFNQFYENNVKNAFDMEQAYQNIGQRQNKNLFGLFKQYTEDCHAMNNTWCAKSMTDARKERAGSGNTLKALQNLTLYKDASTKIGQKQLSERHQRAPYRDIYLKLYKGAEK